ncbi:phosphate ABC transporter substrate-binding protein [Inhella inkyongensis]|uniref:phosphate ABC transporter substrate-binding protein n=1 Tax=Inhella inkyongensis TaxID=392593 RepID=UPI001C30308F|nr:phosphate ABC transporter substrate-binding protein [Inhella inkyongensis]
MAQSLAVVVAKDSKAPPKLSADEVSAIFMGTAKSFPNGEKAVPIDQKAGSEGYSGFYQKAAGKSEAQMKAYWSRIMFTGKGQPPQDAGDGAAVKKLIAANPNMVGYIEAALVDPSVRVVAEIK